MFCSNCGTQLPDNTKFCTNCGAMQTISINVETNNAAVPSAEPAQKPKKKANIWIIIAVIVVAFLAGKLISGSFTSDTDTTTSYSQSSEEPTQSLNVNPEYEAIFEDTYIIHARTFFLKDTASFACKLDNGIIMCADYGYKNDLVSEWVEVVYVPIDGYDDYAKEELKKTVQAEFAGLENLSFCSVEYNMSASYFSAIVTFSDMDKVENCRTLYDRNYLTTNTLISMSATEQQLLSDGFVKKYN